MPVTVTVRPGLAHCGLTESMTTDTCRLGRDDRSRACQACACQACACQACACQACACWRCAGRPRAAGPAAIVTANTAPAAPARHAARLAAPGRLRAAGPVGPARPGAAWVRGTAEMLLPPAQCRGL